MLHAYLAWNSSQATCQAATRYLLHSFEGHCKPCRNSNINSDIMRSAGAAGGGDASADAKTAARLRELEGAKARAVAEEDYDEAKRLKLAIDRLKAVATQLSDLEARWGHLNSFLRLQNFAQWRAEGIRSAAIGRTRVGWDNLLALSSWLDRFHGFMPARYHERYPLVLGFMESEMSDIALSCQYKARR